MTTALLLLVGLLGSDDYRTRESADRLLARTPGTRQSYALLSLVAETSPDPETRHRCSRLAVAHLWDAVDELCPFPMWPTAGMTTIRSWEWTPTYGDPFPKRELYLAFDRTDYESWSRRELKREIVRYVRRTGDWDAPARVLLCSDVGLLDMIFDPLYVNWGGFRCRSEK